MAHMDAVDRARLKARITGHGNHNPPPLDEDDAAERALAEVGSMVSDNLQGLSESIQNEAEDVMDATVEAVGSVAEGLGDGLAAAAEGVGNCLEASADLLLGEDYEKVEEAHKALSTAAPAGATYGVTQVSIGGGINAVWVLPDDLPEERPIPQSTSEAQALVDRVARCSVGATPAVAAEILRDWSRAGMAARQLGAMICQAASAEGKEPCLMNVLILLDHLRVAGGDFAMEALAEVKRGAGARLLQLQSSKQYGQGAMPLLMSTGILEPPRQVDLLDFDETPKTSPAAAPLVDLLGGYTPKAAESEPADTARAPEALTAPAAATPADRSEFMCSPLPGKVPAKASATPPPAPGNDLFDLIFSGVPTPTKPAQRRDERQAPAFAAPAVADSRKQRFDVFDKMRDPSPLHHQRNRFEDLLSLANGM